MNLIESLSAPPKAKSNLPPQQDAPTSDGGGGTDTFSSIVDTTTRGEPVDDVAEAAPPSAEQQPPIKAAPLAPPTAAGNNINIDKTVEAAATLPGSSVPKPQAKDGTPVPAAPKAAPTVHGETPPTVQSDGDAPELSPAGPRVKANTAPPASAISEEARPQPVQQQTVVVTKTGDAVAKTPDAPAPDRAQPAQKNQDVPAQSVAPKNPTLARTDTGTVQNDQEQPLRPAPTDRTVAPTQTAQATTASVDSRTKTGSVPDAARITAPPTAPMPEKQTLQPSGQRSAQSTEQQILAQSGQQAAQPTVHQAGQHATALPANGVLQTYALNRSAQAEPTERTRKSQDVEVANSDLPTFGKDKTSGAVSRPAEPVFSPLSAGLDMGRAAGDMPARTGPDAPAVQVAAAQSGNTLQASPTSGPSGLGPFPPGFAERTVIPQLVQAAQKGSAPGVVDLTLEPPELGRIEIALEIGDKGIRATLIAERPWTGDLLRRHAEMLSQEFQDAGFADVDLDFGDQAANDGRENQNGDTPDTTSEPDALLTQASTRKPVATATGLLDIRR